MLGQGTQLEPFQITQATDLALILNNMSGHYKLMNDLDCTGYTHVPLGNTNNRFTGVFDGDGYTINNLSIIANTQYMGMIGYVDVNGVIKNTKFMNAYVECTGANSSRNVGLVASYCLGTLSNLHVEGTVKANAVNNYVGGLIERATATTIINNIFSNVNVIGARTGAGLVLGAFASNIEESYSNISNIVAVGSVDSTATYQKGIAGHSNAEYPFVNAYFNSENTLTSASVTSVGLSSLDLKTPSQVSLSMDNWIHKDGEYPQLKLFATTRAKHKQTTLEINFDIISVSLERSKNVTKGIDVPLAKTSVINQKQLKTIRQIDVAPFTTSIDITDANIRSITTTIDVDSFTVESSVTKSILTLKSIDLSAFSVNVEVLYPNKKDKPIYALTSVIENPSTTGVITNKSNTTSIQSRTRLEVI